MEELMKHWVEEGLPEGMDVQITRDSDIGNYDIRVGINFRTIVQLDKDYTHFMANPHDIVSTITAQIRSDLTRTIGKWLREHSNCTVREA